ncbi:MAG: hypothetical protein KGZ83_21980 [Sulfuricella sp.]|nr:hypothetical protein [Sulfuricella sp.]
MYIANESEKSCCTCNNWSGTRVLEGAGFVYSLEELQGICKGLRQRFAVNEFDHALTQPNSTCASWEKWQSLAIPHVNAH